MESSDPAPGPSTQPPPLPTTSPQPPPLPTQPEPPPPRVLEDLPHALLISIVGLLGAADRLRLMAVSRAWRDLMLDPEAWGRLVVDSPLRPPALRYLLRTLTEADAGPPPSPGAREQPVIGALISPAVRATGFGGAPPPEATGRGRLTRELLFAWTLNALMNEAAAGALAGALPRLQRLTVLQVGRVDAATLTILLADSPTSLRELRCEVWHPVSSSAALAALANVAAGLQDPRVRCRALKVGRWV